MLHKCTTTMHAIQAKLQRSKESIQTLSERYHLNPKTVLKWKHPGSVDDTPMDVTVSENTPKLSGADGIRGLACLIVLITHAVNMFFIGTPYLHGTGRIGVWLFFVLSAFLLTYKFERSGFSLLSISNYVIGRVLRIIPLFLISVVVYRLLRMAGIKTWSDVLGAIFFRKAYGHLWTIPVEFKFYMWLPFIAFLLIHVRKKFGVIGMTTFFVFSVIVQQSIWPYWKAPNYVIESYWYYPCFGWGIFLAISLRDLERHMTNNVANFLSFLVLIVLALAIPGIRHMIFAAPVESLRGNQFLFIGLVWAIFIACSINGKGWAGYLVKARFLRKLGHRSYSIYLFHWLVYETLSRFFPNNFLAMLASFLGAISLGTLVYNFIERPIENFRHNSQKNLTENLTQNGFVASVKILFQWQKCQFLKAVKNMGF